MAGSKGTLIQTIDKRSAFELTCDKWGSDKIGMLVNFQNVGFTNPKRITESNARGGKVFIFWRSKETFSNDLATLNITGDSGNLFNPDKKPEDTGEILTTGSPTLNYAVGQSHNPIEKKKLFFRLVALTLESHFNDDGTENVFSINYSSPLFQEPVVFYGHFASGLDFNDDAEDPFHVKFSVPFVVYYSSPDFSTIYEKIGKS